MMKATPQTRSIEDWAARNGMIPPLRIILTLPRVQQPILAWDCIMLGSNLMSHRFGKTPLWVVILLTDGVANAGYDQNHFYLCPDFTWANADTYDFAVNPPELLSVLPKCNSGRTKSEAANRHSPISSVDYDAEDYAYDAADYVAIDQSSLIFTIGLGANVEMPSSIDGTHLGELFLEYAADTGDGIYQVCAGQLTTC